MRRTPALALLLLVVGIARLSQAAPAAPLPVAAAPGGTTIQLLTLRRGPELFTGFGHTAMRVIDHASGSDRIFDYGTYDPDDPELASKFLVGALPYWLEVSNFAFVGDWYAKDFGGMVAQTLALTPGETAALVARLEHDAEPANREYPYHHFTNNCTTKVRDHLDAVWGGQLRAATAALADGATYRDLIEGSIYDAPLLRWPVFGLLNGEIDRPLARWEQMFLPVYLMDELDRLVVVHEDGTRGPAVATRETLSGEAPTLPLPAPSNGPWWLLVAGLFVLAALPAALPWRRLGRAWIGAWAALLGLVGSLYGGLQVLAWAVAPYPETAANGNLLAAHPLLIALVPLGVATALGRPWAIRWLRAALVGGVALAIIALALRGVGGLTQHVEGFALPALAASGGLWLGLRRHG